MKEGASVNRWLVLVLVCVAQFMVVLDATIVNVALPSIQHGLHFSAASLQWVVNAYTLVFGGLLTDTLSWRWVFFINLPIGIAAILAAIRYIPESRAEKRPDTADVGGAVSVTTGLLVLVYAIVKSQDYGWTSVRTLGLVA